MPPLSLFERFQPSLVLGQVVRDAEPLPVGMEAFARVAAPAQVVVLVLQLVEEGVEVLKES